MKFLIFVFLICFNFYSNIIDRLSLYTEEYPPYNYYNEKTEAVEGIFIDVIEYILKDNNSKLSKNDIDLLTWARAYNLTLQKNNSVIFATTRSEERENLFKWVGPVIDTKVVLTSKKDKKIKISDIKDIENYKVGLIKDGIAIQTLIGMELDNKNFDVGQTPIANAQKLRANRIDIWAYEERVARNILASISEKVEDYESIYTIKTGYLYFAFNKNTSNEIIKKFQNSLDKLKNQDREKFQEILKKYE